MPDEQLSRRDFLRQTGKAAGFSAVAIGGAALLHEPMRTPFHQEEDEVVVRDLRIPDRDQRLVIAAGNAPAEMTAAALEALGGIGAFIAQGDTVVVKPNIGWDRRPEQAANTHPDVVGEVVRQCMEAGADRVIVTDVTCNEANRCFNRSGIGAAARSAGADVLLPQEARFREVNMGGSMLGSQLVYDAYLTADKFINLPIAKHHSLTRVTLGMKNLYGILGGNRSRLHQEINQSITDLGNFLRPTLVILDAWRVLLRNGPQGGSLADVEERRMLIASNDQVALDACGGELFFDLGSEEMPWLGMADSLGLGRASWRDLPYEEISV